MSDPDSSASRPSSPVHITLVQRAKSSTTTTTTTMSAPASSAPQPALSKRGRHNAAFLDGAMRRILELFRDQWDPESNPEGIIVLGVADNALMRAELLQYFNSNRLKLTPPELTYGDRLFTSARLANALCRLFNEVPVGLDTHRPRLVKPVLPDHIVVGSGATGILDALFTVICDPGDGVLLSVPYYNGFDHDLTSRAEAKIVEVYTPHPEVLDPARPTKPVQPSPAFTPDTVQAYEEALDKARQAGTKVTTLLVCNPHNPTGLVYPRETLVAFAKLAAREKLHLVVDEIYAHSVFHSPDIPAHYATPFQSVLSIDVEAEAGLPRDMVHLVTSASKDFGINGFRHGVYVNQPRGGERSASHDGDADADDSDGDSEVTPAVAAMTGLGMLSQASSPAGALWYTWLEDESFLQWYFAENHRRMAAAYKYVADWAKRHAIPYVPSNSGHFIMLDFRRFLPREPEAKGEGAKKEHKEGDDAALARKAEADLTAKLLDARVFIAPGAQYHHPVPGWFRLTFSLSPLAVQRGLARAEAVLGLQSFIGAVPPPVFAAGVPGG